MNLLFFGADMSWENLQSYGFRRRNTWMLKSFVESGEFNRVYVVFMTTRCNVIRKIFSKSKFSKNDIYIANFFPAFSGIGLFVWLNRLIYHVQFFLQKARGINKLKNIIWCYQIKGFNSARVVNLKGNYYFDTDHNIIDDANIENTQKIKQKQILTEAAKQCKKVISSSRSMLNWYQSLAYDNMLRIRNGVCLKRFLGTKKIKKESITIGYVGTLSRWIDFELFEALVKNNKNFDFIIVGENYKNKDSEKLTEYSNVKLVGGKTANEIPNLLTTFDIALNLYKTEDWLDVDSMKIYEYMAAGVPVVTTKFHPFLEEDFEKLLYIGNNLEEIQSHIDFLIKSPIERNYAYKFLERNTWETRVSNFIQEIKT